MGKFVMPTGKQFLKTKRLFDKKKDPVWVYLENEMKANIQKKPYNEKVGNWIRFLRDLRFFYYCESKRKLRRLEHEVGPRWYVEFSSYQREVLGYLKTNMHHDIIDALPNRVRQSLADLGITRKFKKKMLMDAILASDEDVGIFMWKLYEATYKVSPTVLQEKYSRNAMLLMSSLVFVDLKSCIKGLTKLTASPKEPVSMPPKSKHKLCATDQSPYLEKTVVKCFTTSYARKDVKPKPWGYELSFRSKESYTKLREDLSFIDRRKKKNEELRSDTQRQSTYKFWEPSFFGCPKKPGPAREIWRLKKMIKMKAKKKFRTPIVNIQFHLGGVAFVGKTPNYILPNVTLIPTGYIPIHGGVAPVQKEWVTIIQGHWVFPKKVIVACDATCDCVEKWGDAAIEYLNKNKCKCGHNFDLYNENVECTEKYFHAATRYRPYWIDLPKIFQTDPHEDFIKDYVADAVSSTSSSFRKVPSVGLSEKTILEALLADLSGSSLLIPHLPQANRLNNLLEWTRKRMKGKLTEKDHKRLKLISERRWLDLKHLDFRARAYYLPFTPKQLDNMTWYHRELVQELFDVLLNDFVKRNRMKLLEQTRLWWPTTFYDAYPFKSFLELFYTYMPGRMKDTLLLDPYNPTITSTYGAKTCPLNYVTTSEL